MLDASVAISWCFPGDPTEDTPYSRRILSMLELGDAVVPEVWAFEIANAILVSFNKRKRINEKQIQEYLSRLKALPIRLEARDLWANVELESHSHSKRLLHYLYPCHQGSFFEIIVNSREWKALALGQVKISDVVAVTHSVPQGKRDGAAFSPFAP